MKAKSMETPSYRNPLHKKKYFTESVTMMHSMKKGVVKISQKSVGVSFSTKLQARPATLSKEKDSDTGFFLWILRKYMAGRGGTTPTKNSPNTPCSPSEALKTPQLPSYHVKSSRPPRLQFFCKCPPLLGGLPCLMENIHWVFTFRFSDVCNCKVVKNSTPPQVLQKYLEILTFLVITGQINFRKYRFWKQAKPVQS